MRMFGIFISIDTTFWETSDVETQKYHQKPFLRYKHKDLRSSNHNKTSTSIMIKSFLSVESYFLFSSFAKLKIYVFLKGSVFKYKASPFNKTSYIKHMHGRGGLQLYGSVDQWIEPQFQFYQSGRSSNTSTPKTLVLELIYLCSKFYSTTFKNKAIFDYCQVIHSIIVKALLTSFVADIVLLQQALYLDSISSNFND